MEGYNGWSNYETWVAQLWMDNDVGSYRYYRLLAKGCNDACKLSQNIKEEFEEANPLNDRPSDVFTDLLNSALSEVNWYEIAEHLIDELTEE